MSLDSSQPAGRSRRGFAAMDPERRREIARAGGQAAHAMGLAHRFTPDEARSARAKQRGKTPDMGRSQG